ncbi:MAG: type II secretion system F family protein [Pseudomonadota bacterium]
MSAEQSFAYVAENDAGKIVRGQIDAASETLAARMLRTSKLAPIDISPAGTDSASLLSFLHKERRLPVSVFARITRKLSDLLGSSIPLRDALRLCAAQEKHKTAQRFLERVTKRVSAGAVLSKAFRDDDLETPRLVNALTLSAERTGKFAENFERLADTLEAGEKFRREMIAQMVYPVALAILITLTLVFLSFFVLPQFETIFSTAGAEAPASTKFVLAAGAAVRAHWQLAPLLFLALLIGGRLAVQYAGDDIDRALTATPTIGSLLKKMEIGRFCRSLGALVVNGAPLAEALPVAAEAVSSPSLRRACKAAEKDVRSGKYLSPALREARAAPEEVTSLIEIGERTGRLGAMALKAADHCEADVSDALKRFAALASPVMTALMGLLVAGVIASVMIGVLSLNDAIY